MSSLLRPPILLTEDGPSQDVLTCPLCCELPLDPVVTSCHHIFCRPCILQALENRGECPNDRHPLTEDDLRAIDGPLRRIWERIQVSCPSCDSSWSGTVGNYAAHAQRCGMSAVFANAEQYAQAILDLRESHHQEMERLKASHRLELQRISSTQRVQAKAQIEALRGRSHGPCHGTNAVALG